MVSIHAPAWGATWTMTRRERAEIAFQSTHPRGVRRGDQAGGPGVQQCFNPRTRVGCDGASVACVLIVTWFQSTHPRGVRLRLLRLLPDSLVVSIHAPAWGASPDGIAQLGQAPVSIHAPAWGATTAPNGRNSMTVRVSIHAPAWGATGAGSATKYATPFQSTHPRGVRRFHVLSSRFP